MQLNKNEINYSAPDLMTVCVDDRYSSDISGRLYHRGRPEPIFFKNSGQLLLEMENWCDRIGYPQPEVLGRKFNRNSTRRQAANKSNREHSISYNGGGTEEVLQVAGEDLLKKEGEEGTFIVHIKYRQNATWQGQVTWAEKKQTCNFRSALELLKLIDCALSEGTADGSGGECDGSNPEAI